MPRILFLTYAYPPLAAAGSVRAGGIAKYLPQFGWDVVVLTAKLPSGSRPAAQIVETEYQSVIAQWKSRFRMDPKESAHAKLKLSLPSQPNSNRLHTNLLLLAKNLIAFPDEHKGWIRFAEEALSKLKPSEKPDIILSSSPPASVHLIAAKARRLFNRPWVADFRDLWSENLWGVTRLLQPLHQRLEKKTLSGADALVSVSEPWARSLQGRYPHKPVYTITNGFDPDDFDHHPNTLTEYFSLTHTGRLYEGRRDPTLLFDVLHELVKEELLDKRDLRVRFFGPAEPWLALLAQRYELSDVVEIGGMVTRKEALLRQAESQILLLLGWADPKETGQHTGKLFEYFGSRRPILAVGGSVGVLTDTLRQTGTGVHVSDRNSLRQHLLSLYGEFKTLGSISYHVNQEALHPYTHTEMARRFSDVLHATLTGTVASPRVLSHRKLPDTASILS